MIKNIFKRIVSFFESLLGKNQKYPITPKAPISTKEPVPVKPKAGKTEVR